MDRISITCGAFLAAKFCCVHLILQQRKGSTKALFRGCIVLYVNLPIVQLAIVHATSSSRPSLMIFLDPEPDPDPGESQDFGPGPGGVPKWRGSNNLTMN